MTSSLLNPFARTTDTFFGVAARARLWGCLFPGDVQVGTLFELFDGRWAVVRTAPRRAPELLSCFASLTPEQEARARFEQRWAAWLRAENGEAMAKGSNAQAVSRADEAGLAKLLFGATRPAKGFPTPDTLEAASAVFSKFQEALRRNNRDKLARRTVVLGEALYARPGALSRPAPRPTRSDCNALAVVAILSETGFQDGLLDVLMALAHTPSGGAALGVLRRMHQADVMALQELLDSLFVPADPAIGWATAVGPNCETRRLTLADWLALRITPVAAGLADWLLDPGFLPALQDAEIPF